MISVEHNIGKWITSVDVWTPPLGFFDIKLVQLCLHILLPFSGYFGCFNGGGTYCTCPFEVFKNGVITPLGLGVYRNDVVFKVWPTLIWKRDCIFRIVCCKYL